MFTHTCTPTSDSINEQSNKHNFETAVAAFIINYAAQAKIRH